MKLQLLVLATFLSAPSTIATESAPPYLYIPDGQILAIPVRVYVASTNLDTGMRPRLQLAGFKAAGRTNVAHLKLWEPFVVAPSQTWTERVEGQMVPRQGTLLIFDLNGFALSFPKSTTRVTPVLSWQPPDLDPSAATPLLVGQWVYLGRRWVAGLWTLLVVSGLLAFIRYMAVSKGKEVLHVISGEEGYISLWRTQLAAWTIAVGSMVFLFSLIQLGVPRIPETLVVLMGMSVATGGLSAIAAKPAASPASSKSQQDRAKTRALPQPDPISPGPKQADRPRWSDLISAYNPKTGGVILSVSKAQMVFWTGVILVLFVVKSLLSGELWEVPWELVTLTGVSQAGYVSDKALQRRG